MPPPLRLAGVSVLVTLSACAGGNPPEAPRPLAVPMDASASGATANEAAPPPPGPPPLDATATIDPPPSGACTIVSASTGRRDIELHRRAGAAAFGSLQTKARVKVSLLPAGSAYVEGDTGSLHVRGYASESDSRAPRDPRAGPRRLLRARSHVDPARPRRAGRQRRRRAVGHGRRPLRPLGHVGRGRVRGSGARSGQLRPGDRASGRDAPARRHAHDGARGRPLRRSGQRGGRDTRPSRDEGERAVRGGRALTHRRDHGRRRRVRLGVILGFCARCTRSRRRSSSSSR